MLIITSLETSAYLVRHKLANYIIVFLQAYFIVMLQNMYTDAYGFVELIVSCNRL